MTINIFRLLYEPKFMIEMDRFVFYMRGVEYETIERKSTESAATMKEQGTTLIE